MLKEILSSLFWGAVLFVVQICLDLVKHEPIDWQTTVLASVMLVAIHFFVSRGRTTIEDTSKKTGVKEVTKKSLSERAKGKINHANQKQGLVSDASAMNQRGYSAEDLKFYLYNRNAKLSGIAGIVPEQQYPDGNFPTCPYPNPEIFEALRLGLELAEKEGADLMLATDPDADRVGIAMKCPDGSYELVSGNEVGALLLDYICAGRIEKGTMPENAVAVKSLVSTPLADAIAAHYGVEMRNVLTGFKWIGDQIAQLEAAGEVDRFIFGFEESYGYLAGPYVRDKDAVIGSMLICEMAAYYRSIGSSLKQRMEEIYAQYGRYLNKTDSYEFPGLSGMDKMAGTMADLRQNPPAAIGEYKVVKVIDYKKPEETGLPAANVLVYKLEGGAEAIVRPSGTEPKIKTYFTTLGKDLAEAQAQKDALAAALKPIFS